VVKKVVQEKPKNVFAMLDIEQELEEQEVEELEEPEQEVEEQLEELKKTISYFDWWEEMKDDMSYLAA
jgi:chaperonin cofactor prefoldin